MATKMSVRLANETWSNANKAKLLYELIQQVIIQQFYTFTIFLLIRLSTIFSLQTINKAVIFFNPY